MNLYTTSLNSGSNGNCYYVGNDEEAVFVDAGISCREIERRMLRSGLALNKVKALFISHEHSDHIRGVEVLSRKYRIPVYFTPQTLRSSGLQLEADLIRTFKTYEVVQVGKLSVVAFPKFHDASEPHSFVIEQSGTRIGVFTDIGNCCEHVIQNFRTCHAVFLESNYDVKMLEEGRYPYHLKRRIRDGHGHLSNDQALELFTKYKSSYLSHLFLSHLSKDNNDPELVQKLFSKNAGKTFVTVASRYREMDVYKITKEKNSIREIQVNPGVQMRLF